VLKANHAWSDCIHVIYNNTCARCKRKVLADNPMLRSLLHPHHIISVGVNPSLRWAILNGILLCYECHCWATDHPAQCDEWLRNEFPTLWQFMQDNQFKRPRFQVLRIDAEQAYEELAKLKAKLVKMGKQHPA